MICTVQGFPEHFQTGPEPDRNYIHHVPKPEIFFENENNLMKLGIIFESCQCQALFLLTKECDIYFLAANSNTFIIYIYLHKS